MLAPMSESDVDILQHIQGLVDEEHQIRDGGGEPDASRLQHLEEQLDQCWDLLRQRRARREFAENPDDASARSASTVEHYSQ